MRKQILKTTPTTDAIGSATPGAPRDTLDIAAIATVLVTSESTGNPIENAFDGRGGPSGTRWIADAPGEQTLILAFDRPQTIRSVGIEVEEPSEVRTQELHLSVSRDGGISYRDVLRQEFNFAPPGTSFEREEWTLGEREVTHFRLRIKPDKGDRVCRACLTTLFLR
ncbi:MAG: discoidin domain-containing protein [Limisphaerales bacterium]